MSKTLLALSLSCLSAVGAASLFSASPVAAQQEGEGRPYQFRVTSDLVQVDVIVTDKKGKPVLDLKAGDFEILEDGEPREVTYFQRISTAAPQSEAAPAPRTSSPAAAAPPPPPLAFDQVSRTVALVVDDWNLAFSSATRTRRAIQDYVREMVEPGDLVAILRTGGALGALQQFTSDRRLLAAAADRIQYNAMTGRVDINFVALFDPPTAEAGAGTAATGVGAVAPMDDVTFMEARADMVGRWTLATLRRVVEQMGPLPGRKSIVLFSEGFRLTSDEDESMGLPEPNLGLYDDFLSLVDQAYRSGVTLYTIDPRGLVSGGMGASERLEGADVGPGRMARRRAMTMSRMSRTQHSLAKLAEATGGFAIQDNNDLPSGLEKILADQETYYLLGYQPVDNAEVRPGHFHKLTVRVRKPGLKVRHRTGFFEEPLEAPEPEARTPQEQVLAEVLSPFPSTQIGVRVTPGFTSDPRSGPAVQALVHIDAARLKVTPLEDGTSQATVGVHLLLFGDNGKLEQHLSQRLDVNLTEATLPQFLAEGFVHAGQLQVGSPGTYQLRAVVRDEATGKLGSAGVLVEIPDLEKERLALSTILLTEKDEDGPPSLGGSVLSAQEAGRRFDAEPMTLQYAFSIFNPKISRTTGLPELKSRVSLFRNGQALFEGSEQKIGVLEQRPESRRVDAAGELNLKSLQPGHYALQVTITDALASKKKQQVSQWIDFEIVK